MNLMDYYFQAVKLNQKGDHAAAIEVFNTALGEDPDSTTLLEGRASSYRQNGEPEKALADYTRIIALQPDRPDGWNGRGNLYHDLGEYDKAIADFTTCIPLSPAGYGSYWSNRGISYYEKGDLDAALADLNQSIATWSEPDCSAWALFYRGLVWKKKGDLDKALEDFTQAAVYDPRDAESFYQAGYIWFTREEFPKAIECFTAAIAAREDTPEFWLARGVCYWNQCRKNKTGFWDEGGEAIDLAIEDFTQMIERSPGSAEGYFNRGMIRCSKARESNNLIKTIVTQKATDEAGRVALLTQLGHIGGKNLIPSVDALLRGLRSNRDQADVLMAESFGLVAKEDALEATEDLSRAIELNPEHAEAYYHRGLAYSLLGEAEKALADYEKTCALNPAHEQAAGKREALLNRQE
jgi:tetratricopeptide (TPR) repeat protein